MRVVGAGFLCACLLASPAWSTETISFSYDDLGRLSQTSTTGDVNNGFSTSISYDATGNRTNYTMSGSANPTPLTDPDAIAYVAAMTVQPDAARKGLINELITGLKLDGIWSKLSWLSLLAAHDAQAALLNVKAPTKSLTAILSPTFTVDRGYQGNGSTSYLESPESLTAAGQYTLNSASIGVYVNQAGTTTQRTAIGVRAGDRATLYATSTGWFAAVNSTSAGEISIPTSVNTGLIAAFRGSSSKAGIRGNGIYTYISSTSEQIPSVNPTFGKAGASYYSNDREAVIFWGNNLTNTEFDDFTTRLTTYLSAIGAN